MVKRNIFALSLALILICAAPLWAARHHGHGPQRPPGYDPSVNIWTDLDLDEDDAKDETGKIAREDADGVVTVVPNSPGRWLSDIDIGMNTFEMIAPLSLPRTIKSADISQMCAIFNSEVDRKTVDTIIDEDFASLSVSGRLARGAASGRLGRFDRVELIQIIVETADGRVLIQDLSVGLDVW